MPTDVDPDCLFCKIAAGQLPSARLYEDEDVYAFEDIHPQAPFHAVVIPKRHIATVDDLQADQAGLAGKLFLIAKALAAERRLPGYRVAVNVNREGGQTVFHLHMHVLGGRQMRAELG